MKGVLIAIAQLPFLVLHAQGQEASSSIPQSAKSFQELAKVDARIKKLLDWESSYVCFQSDADIFYLLSFETVDETLWKKSDKIGEFEQQAKAVLTEYRDGILNETGEQLHFAGSGKDVPSSRSLPQRCWR